MELCSGDDRVQTVVCTAVLALMDRIVVYKHTLKINLHLEYEIDNMPHQVTFKQCLTKEKQSSPESEADAENAPTQDSESIITTPLKQALIEEKAKEVADKSKVTMDKLAADIGLDFVRQWDWPEGEEEDAKPVATGKNACQVCNKAFTFATNLTRHEKNIHGIQPQPHKNYDVITEKEEEQPEKAESFKCNLCEREFPLYQNLGRHLQKAHKVCVVDHEMQNGGDGALHGKGDFVCSLCGHRFTFQSNLSRHFAKVHKRCPKAKRHKAIVLSSPEGKVKTKAAKKNDRARHKCEICGCRFTFRSNLNRHMNKVHRKRSPLRTLRSSAANTNGDRKDDKEKSTQSPQNILQPSESPSNVPMSNSNHISPSPNTELPLPPPLPPQNSMFQTPVNPWNTRQSPRLFTNAQSTFPAQTRFSTPHAPSTVSPDFTSPPGVYSTYTSPVTQTSPFSPPSNSTPVTLQPVLKMSPYSSPNVPPPYTPTQQMSPMSQISPLTQISPYTSPLNRSSSFTDQSSGALQPSVLQPSPLFSQPPSSSSSPSFQHPTPHGSVIPSPVSHCGPRTISPVIIRPIVSTSPSPTHSEIEKRGSVTPTGPLSPLVPPPDLEISSQVSPSHALAPPVPLRAPSPDPPPIPNIPSTTVSYPVPLSRSSIPTSFSIPHLSSNPLSPSSSSLLSPPFSHPPHPPSLPLSSALPPALSVSHLSSSPLPPSHLLSLVHNAPMSLVHHNAPMLPSPGSFLPRSCRKFSCTLCTALFSFQSNAKRHFLSQHSTAPKDIPMFRELILPVTTSTTSSTSTTTAATSPSSSTSSTSKTSVAKSAKAVKNSDKSKLSTKNKECTETIKQKTAESEISLPSKCSTSTISQPSKSEMSSKTKVSTTSKSESSVCASSKSTSKDKAPTEKPQNTKDSKRENGGRSAGKARRFVCEKCPATYTFRTNLTRHMRQKHGGME